MGMVSAANVEGANIFIKGGVRGMNRGFIKARGDFHASFAENADIEAGGDIFIQDVAMHSTIRAGHHLIMDEGKGQITGGNLAAGEEIRAARGAARALQTYGAQLPLLDGRGRRGRHVLLERKPRASVLFKPVPCGRHVSGRRFRALRAYGAGSARPRPRALPWLAEGRFHLWL